MILILKSFGDKDLANSPNEKDENSLIKNIAKSKLDANINENQGNIIEQNNKNSNLANNLYTLLPVNKFDNDISLKLSENKKHNHSHKKSKIKVEENYYKNTCKIKSIIGILLNIIFWIWFIFYLLDYNEIIIFPRGSIDNKKVIMVYSGINSNNFIAGFINSLFFTIFNHYIPKIYPETILIISYIVYICYSLFNTNKEKYRNNVLLLSKNTYIILLFLGIGELYKLFARKYLDI